MKNQSHRPRVAWLVSSPTPYKLPFFRQLVESTHWDMHFWFCTWKSASRAWEISEGDLPSADVLWGCKLPLPGKGRSFLRLNPGVVVRILRNRWDIVVISGYNHLTMLLAILCCILTGTPFIIQGESHVLKRRGRGAQLAKRCLIFPLLRRCTAAFATGTLSRQYWESIGIAKDRIFVVANTPDVEHFVTESRHCRKVRESVRREYGIPPESLLGIFVGRLISAKGLDTLLEATRLLPSEQRAHLLLVGDGPQRPRLERMARDHDLPVKFAGFRQNDELPSLYAAADFFVLPSRDEPWGVVVNEAMAAGLPVLLSDQVGAAHDLIESGRNGWMVAAGSPQRWATAISRVISLRHDLPRMGECSRNIVRGWTHATSAIQFERAIQESTARRKAA